MYRIDTLLKQDQKLFHTNDLAILWNITNRNTLYTTVKRYLKKGILIPIHKGYYSTVPTAQLDPIRLGAGYLHRYVYVSCETVLVENGLIFQKSPYITLVSDVSKKFSISGWNFLARSMRDRFLYNNIGIVSTNGILKATVDRAVADLLYFNPRSYFDNQNGINWKQVRLIQKEVGY